MDAKELGAMPISAFQPLGQGGTPSAEMQPGLTLRQHYAGLAMQGLLANTDAEDAEAHKFGLFAGPLSENAVLFADALLAELAKEPQP